MTTIPDYSQYASREPRTEDLAQLRDLVDQMLQAKDDLADAVEETRRRKDALEDFSRRSIPELMVSVGLEKFTTTGGMEVIIKPKAGGAPAAANRAEAYAWLEANGQGGLVKRTVEVAFATGQGEESDELQARLGLEFPGNVREAQKVEPSSMSAFIRRAMEDPAFPRELFGVYEYDEAVVKARKK